MAVNSRKKGAKAERKVADLFSEWAGRKFHRVPASGGLRWKNRSDTIGDITCGEERHFFPFVIEVKTRKEINFEHLLYLDNSEILKFWEQAQDESKRAKKPSLLFMRYNGMPKDIWFIAMSPDIWRICRTYLDLKKPHMILRPKFIIIRSDILFNSPYKKLRREVITYIDKTWPREN